MNVLILTNGEYGDYSFCKENITYDYVICADKGMKHARKLGIVPQLIVGDFDSGSEEDLLYFKEQGIEIESFDPVKDETDTELAIKRAVHKGATSITVYGGIGTRLDHSLANVHLLYGLINLGIKGRLMNPYNTVYLVLDEIVLEGEKGALVSLIPFAGEVCGITTQHLGYPLTDATLKMGTSLGVSNYMTENVAKISIQSGVLMVICARD